MLFIKEDNEYKASPNEDTSFKKEAFENERELQNLIFEHPNILADDSAVVYYSVGMEKRLPSNNRIDNLLIDNNGNVIVVEDKLSRNPGVERDVVAQIADYISDLKGYSYYTFNDFLNGELERVSEDIKKQSGKDIRSTIDASLMHGKIKLFIAVDEANEKLKKIMDMIQGNNPDSRLFVVEKYDHGNTIKVTSKHKKPDRKVTETGTTTKSKGQRNQKANTDDLTRVADLFKEKIVARELKLLTPKATRDIWFLTNDLVSILPKPPREASVQKAILVFAIHLEIPRFTFRLVINGGISNNLKKVLKDEMKNIEGAGDNGSTEKFPFFFDKNATRLNFSSIDGNEINEIWQDLDIDNIVKKVEDALKAISDKLKEYASPHL